MLSLLYARTPQEPLNQQPNEKPTKIKCVQHATERQKVAFVGTVHFNRRFPRGGISMLTNTQATRASFYREKSVELRLLAAQAQFFESRAQLLALAEGFGKLAEHVDVWEGARAAAD
jgi:hypothetical protein